MVHVFHLSRVTNRIAERRRTNTGGGGFSNYSNSYSHPVVNSSGSYARREPRYEVPEYIDRKIYESRRTVNFMLVIFLLASVMLIFVKISQG